MVRVLFSRSRKSSELYLKEAGLKSALSLGGHFAEDELAIETFLDYCTDSIKSEMGKTEPDMAYIAQCNRRIDRYTPMHERLLGMERGSIEDVYVRELREQMDSIYKDLDDRGLIKKDGKT